MMRASFGNRIRTILAAAGLLLTTCGLAFSQQFGSTPPGATSQASTSPGDDTRSAKQKLLDDQAQRLVTMAAELKVEVDKTNKNILSIHVVRKAEEIEALAHRMKDQGKR